VSRILYYSEGQGVVREDRAAVSSRREATVDSTEKAFSVDRESFAAFTREFSETARTLFSAGGVSDTLAQIVELSVALIEGCDYAGLFLVDGDAVSTPVLTDQIVQLIDDLQRQSGAGPCLDAITRQLIFYSVDLVGEQRWPDFASSASANGIRSVLALPLSVNGTVGALNLYARYPDAFGVLDRGRATLLASLAGLALLAARSHEDEDRLADNLHAALGTRELIGQAEGILMQRERITGEQAFDILRRASQHLNLKLREVAQNLVETGEGPDTGPAR
jgi:hypothetical protein